MNREAQIIKSEPKIETEKPQLNVPSYKPSNAQSYKPGMASVARTLFTEGQFSNNPIKIWLSLY